MILIDTPMVKNTDAYSRRTTKDYTLLLHNREDEGIKTLRESKNESQSTERKRISIPNDLSWDS